MSGFQANQRLEKTAIPAGRRYLLCTLLSLIVLFAIGSAMGIEFFESVYLPVLLGLLLCLAAAGCLRQSRSSRRDRTAWLFFAAGIISWTSGMACRFIFFDAGGDRPVPASIDPLFLAFYPAMFTGLALIIRARLRRFGQIPWLDGLTCILAVTAILVTWFDGSFREITNTGELEAVVLLAYPIGDLILVLMVLSLATVGGLRHDGPWVPIESGLVLFAVADALFAFVSPSSYETSTPLWVLWMLGALLILVGTWREETDVREASPGHRQLLIPLAFTVAAIGVLLAGQGTDLQPGAVPLALATLVAVLIRLVLSAQENRKMFETRREGLTDELTGLPSKQQVNAWLDDFVSTAGGNFLLVINLDRFRELNVALGNHAGDEILSAVASRLNGTITGHERLGRLGGDEFILFSTAVGAGEDVAPGPEYLAGEVAACLGPPFLIDGLKIHVDATVGAATDVRGRLDGNELLRRAVVALKGARARQEPYAHYSADEGDRARQQLTLLEEFRSGLAQNELVLNYQPKVRLADLAVPRAEALVRWQHPEEGLLSPFRFIAMAEEAGLMHEVTTQVLDLAITQMGEWQAVGFEMGVAVNLAMPNLLDTGLPVAVEAALMRQRVAPTKLTMEITENIVMSDQERVLGVINRLREIGTKVSLDDFGVGNTSLAFLTQLPLDEVKMDRSLVGNIVGSKRDAAIAQAAISIATELELEIVAEGVEDLETARLLKNLGCNQIQGYVFAKPMPAAEIPPWLRSFRDLDLASSI